jgi:hypothetical protein
LDLAEEKKKWVGKKEEETVRKGGNNEGLKRK